MRWKNETSERPLFLDYIFAQEMVYDAYSEGYINWNIYQTALDHEKKQSIL
jgi:hypothetical protein